MRPQDEIQLVLAIETSCDDTSVALVRADGWVIACKSADQNRAHEAFGGVVPEIAGRNHTHHLLPLIDSVLRDSGQEWNSIHGIVVTSCPGLIGSLLVGVVTAKTLALAHDKPFLGVNHLEGHLLAPFLRDKDYAPPRDFDYPYIALAVSGGHTSLYQVHALGDYEVLGHSIDDAAGEAFDKFGKLIGLGFPGGVRVDRLAQRGDPKAIAFPRVLLQEDSYRMSFSGLKTSGLRWWESRSLDEQTQITLAAQKFIQPSAVTKDTSIGEKLLCDACASYQEAIVDVLISRLKSAIEKTGLKRAVVTGGVSANSRLRVRAETWAKEAGVTLVIPPLRYCTDNAAMIGLAGILRMRRDESSPHTLGPVPRAPLGRGEFRGQA